MPQGIGAAVAGGWTSGGGEALTRGAPSEATSGLYRPGASIRPRDTLGVMTPPTTATHSADRLRAFVQDAWDTRIVPALTEYIRIPAKSPGFDKDWQAHGHLDRAVELAARWARERPVEGLQVEVVRLPGRTPVLLTEVPGNADATVLLYGHLDKQPEMTGWSEGLGPWTPVRRDDRLYGRGAADDGYAAFAALTAIEALQAQGVPHARCVVLVETCEESGSADLPAYMDHLASRLGTPGLVICLDASCGNYDQLWLATSLRGLVAGELAVEVLAEGIHSGASGIVPSSFRILRQLLSRLEDEGSGEIRPRDFHVEIRPERVRQAQDVAAAIGGDLAARVPLVPGMRTVHADPIESILAHTWRPALAITGADGLPPIADGGNVLRPRTAVKVSLRIPPTLDARAAARRLQQLFETDPPYGARVRFTPSTPSPGWDAPRLAAWLARSLERASIAHFGRPPMSAGVGGSIPFMSMLGERFPAAQFVVTGVLGPGSNAHGPNEFLHIPTGVRVTGCVAEVLADHHRAGRG
jgi:acetylornithine deacetylase/succinyl-diaminopimelate desuccinylase-like protein